MLKRSTIRRGLMTAAMSCGVVTAATGTVMAQPAAAPTIGINAKSQFHSVSGDVFVQYADTYHGGNLVKIKGSVTGSSAGEVIKLYAQRFPFKKAPAPVAGQVKTLPAPITPITPIPYSFTAKPTLATKYTVRLFPNRTSQSPLATSHVQHVYVVTGQPVSYNQCTTRPVCHITAKVKTHLPASAYSTEVGKKLYFYFGLTHTSSRPRWLYLDPHATITTPKRISATEYEQTIKWSFRIGFSKYDWEFNGCTRDTEAKDGINLPGHHSCGASRIPSTIAYLG